MTSSQNRRENRWNQRKQNQQPHGKVKSLAELSAELGTTKQTDKEQQ
ncbi:DUF6254 family protein [Paenibacillus sp. NEAU-GSW1]|nr:DUF6254 family protein [Paenibacillus sp. NEAU-GSW1]